MRRAVPAKASAPAGTWARGAACRGRQVIWSSGHLRASEPRARRNAFFHIKELTRTWSAAVERMRLEAGVCSLVCWSAAAPQGRHTDVSQSWSVSSMGRRASRKAESTCQNAEEVCNGHVLSRVVDLLYVTLVLTHTLTCSYFPCCMSNSVHCCLLALAPAKGLPKLRPCLDVLQEQIVHAVRAPVHGAWEGVARVAGPVVCQHEHNAAVWDAQPGRKRTCASLPRPSSRHWGSLTADGLKRRGACLLTSV